MKKKKIIVGVVLSVLVIAFFVASKFIGPKPCLSQQFVEEYVSKYSNDFSFIKNKSYSLILNGFKESDETDWYFYDNELGFEFHVKTLKGMYPPKNKHIACNYYDSYMEELIKVKGEEIKQVVMDMFVEIYDIENYDMYYYHDTSQLRISIDGTKNSNFSKERCYQLFEIASNEICKIIEEYDVNFKNRSKMTGWDVNLNTDWSDDDALAIMINGEIFKIYDYYND